MRSVPPHREAGNRAQRFLALTDACVQHIYRASHRRSLARRAIHADLTVRDGLVQMRTRVISMTRAFTRGEGLRIQSGATHMHLDRLRSVAMSTELSATLAPLQAVLELLNEDSTHRWADQRPRAC